MGRQAREVTSNGVTSNGDIRSDGASRVSKAGLGEGGWEHTSTRHRVEPLPQRMDLVDFETFPGEACLPHEVR